MSELKCKYCGNNLIKSGIEETASIILDIDLETKELKIRVIQPLSSLSFEFKCPKCGELIEEINCPAYCFPY